MRKERECLSFEDPNFAEIIQSHQNIFKEVIFIIIYLFIYLFYLFFNLLRKGCATILKSFGWWLFNFIGTNGMIILPLFKPLV